jgi:DNA repair protein RadC
MSRFRYGYSREVRVMCLGEREYPSAVVNRPELVVDYWQSNITRASWYDREKEIVVVIAMNRKNNPIGFALVSVGTACESLIHPREVFRPAVALGAVAIVLCHNHPSGDPAPSAGDGICTQRIQGAAAAMDIELLDHVIIGHKDRDPQGQGFYSFKAAETQVREIAAAMRRARRMTRGPANGGRNSRRSAEGQK